MSGQPPGLLEIGPQRVLVFGAGAWGVVLAGMLSRHGHQVRCWDPSQRAVETLRREGRHPKLEGFRLPETLFLSADLDEALNFGGGARAEFLVAVAPSQAMRGLAEECRRRDLGGTDGPPWVLCAKGIEEDTLLTMDGVLREVLGEDCAGRLAVLSGPSFADEVARGKPTTVTVASRNGELAARVQALFMHERFRVYTESDVLGVELGGAVKNVVAIAAGACEGLGLGENARAALITRGLAEILRLAQAMGAQPRTLSGLSGLGDLILTCAGGLSRNRRFGELLARGRDTRQAQEEIGMVVEGLRTARAVRTLAHRHEVEMPIVEEIYRVIYENKAVEEAVADLMGRAARPEKDR